MLFVTLQSLSIWQLASRLLFGTLLTLLLPMLAMQLSAEVQWGPADFVVAGALLFCTMFAVVLAWRVLPGRFWRGSVILLLIVAALLVWAELAVGVF